MTETTESGLDRRTFFRRSAGVAAGLAVASRFEALGTGVAGAAPASAGAARGKHARGGYGPLYPVKDQTTGLELIKLPRGFEYLTFGWTGDPMRDGRPTPDAHDGMAAFDGRGGRIHLVRNHERGTGPALAPGMTYDPAAGGGTTTLVFDPRRRTVVDSHVSLAGTIRNCAGGPTPWGTWLSCEETTDVVEGRRHGYVFEVPMYGAATGVPLTAMGRFSHEAAAVDPWTGIVYETEDATPSGFYRFVPNRRGKLAAGGRLQMLKIGDGPAQTYGDTGPKDYGRVSWVDIPTPDPAPGETSVVQQGIAAGGASFERLEGAWYDRGKIFFVSTSGGPARGQVFEYTPATDRLRLIFSSPNLEVLDSPDNVCTSPRGGMVLCEDGSGTEYLHGLTPHGEIFPFAENMAVLNGERNGIAGDFTGSEWCGATFEPRKGEWLFANLQSPGITFAITGPWHKGAL